MAINLELPKKLKATEDMFRAIAEGSFRPISRKYDQAEHEYPVELDTLTAMSDGTAGIIDTSGATSGRSADGEKKKKPETDGNRNGGNMSSVINAIELSWGDVALMLTVPYQGLGNAAIAAVSTDEQLKKFGKTWAAMAITEPTFGSDSAAVKATAKLDGDEWVINGEKIFVTAGKRCTHIVVWASLDREKGRAAIKSFVVPRETPGMNLIRLEHKLGIRASDTAAYVLDNVRIPKDNILGSPEIDVEKGFGGVMQTFDNTRPLVAGMAVGVSRASLEVIKDMIEKAGYKIDYDKPLYSQHAIVAEYIRMEAEYEAALLLTFKSAWMADNKKPNSMEASMAKAKAGRIGSDITLKAVELAGSLGYSEETLLEKWGRDSKILDIFEGTQQIQQLIVARRLLGLNSSQLK